MATVNVLCPNGRRVTVKSDPNSPLMQVLEQTCSKQKLDANRFILKHGKTTLDLSCPFRYSGLINNAKLELVESELPHPSGDGKKVTLVVQTNQGKRVQGLFGPSSSLWAVLEELGLAQCEPRLEPVLVYMRQQVAGKKALQAMTLKKLGLAGGGATLRLSYQQEVSSSSSLEKEEEGKQTPKPGNAGPVEGIVTEQRCPPGQDLEREGLSEDQKGKPSFTVASGATIKKAVHIKEGQKSSNQQVMEIGKEAAEGGQEAKEAGRKDMEMSEGVGASLAFESDMLQFPVLPFSVFPEEVQLPSRDRLTEPVDSQAPPPLFVDAKALQQAMVQSMLAQVQMEHAQSADEGPNTSVGKRRVYEEPCDRETVVFHLDDLPTTPTNEELPEAFYEVTKEDVQLMHRDLQRQVKRLSEAPLLTNALRVQQGPSSRYSRAVVRVRLPDKWVLQGCFRAGESLKALVQFIRQHLSNQQTKFHLYTTPPKKILHSGRVTFAEAGFLPAAWVHVAIDDDGPGRDESQAREPILSQECLRNFHKSHEEAELLASRERTPVTRNSALEPPEMIPSTSSSSTTLKATTATQESSAGTGKPVPKWFKLGPK